MYAKVGLALWQDFNFYSETCRKESSISLPIHVNAYAGYRADERPRQFCFDEDVFEIVEGNAVEAAESVQAQSWLRVP